MWKLICTHQYRLKVGDEPRYFNKNATINRVTSFTYQPGVCTNLEVTVLYAQVEVKVLPVVAVYRVRGSFNSLMEGEQTLF